MLALGFLAPVSAQLLLTYEPAAVMPECAPPAQIVVDCPHRTAVDSIATERMLTQFMASKKWRRYLKRAAQRYSVPGKFDPDEGLQEAYIVAWGLISEGFDISTRDFRAMFKTAMWHRMIDLNAHYRTKGRNYRREKSLSKYKSTGSASNNSDFFSKDKDGGGVCSRRFDNPASLVEHQENVELLFDALPEYARPLLKLMINPGDELRVAYENYLARKKMKRRKKMPIKVYARAMGVKYRVVSRALKVIRRTSMEIFGDRCLPYVDEAEVA